MLKSLRSSQCTPSRNCLSFMEAEVHYLVHMRPSLVFRCDQPSLSAHLPHQFNNHFTSILPSAPTSSCFPLISSLRVSQPTLCTLTPYPLACLFPALLILLIVFVEECKLWRSSFCTSLQPPITSSPFGPNILISTLYSNILNLSFSFNVRDHSSH